MPFSLRSRVSYLRSFTFSNSLKAYHILSIFLHLALLSLFGIKVSPAYRRYRKYELLVLVPDS